MKLKPHSHDTQLIYKCPACRSKHWMLQSEVARPHAAIHCHCGVVSEVEQVTGLKLNVQYGDKPQTEHKKPISVTLNLSDKQVAKAKSLIVAAGFSGSEAKTLITRAISSHNRDIENPADLVKYALAEAEEINDSDATGTTG